MNKSKDGRGDIFKDDWNEFIHLILKDKDDGYQCIIRDGVGLYWKVEKFTYDGGFILNHSFTSSEQELIKEEFEKRQVNKDLPICGLDIFHPQYKN